jgi:HrpA-like RNA helicase
MYLTDGMLLREAILDPTLKKFSVIILDEVHERTINTDVLMSIIKGLKNTTRPDLKIVVMSATIDIPKISEYFDIESVVSVEGRTFPVEIYNIKESEANYVDNALIAILQVHLEQPEGDILCFLTGQEDIEDLQSLLKEKIELGKHPEYDMPPLTVVPLYANLPNHLQLQAFEKLEGSRKVILATNIAETSITINGIKYIIDTGLCKIKTYQATTGVETLKISAISQNSATQRAGRAGREADGKCFRLYTEEIFNELEVSTPPEIFRTNLSRTILQLKAMGIKDVSDFDFIDKPNKTMYIKAFKELRDLKCLDLNADLNSLGKKMAIIPSEPMYSHLLLHALKGCYNSIVNDIVIIVSLLSVENIFYSPRNTQRKAERKHK